MKESKQEVENAVIIIGEFLGMKDSTKHLLSFVGIYSTIKEIVFKTFVEEIDEFGVDSDNVFDSYQIIRRYCEEMMKNGEVKFNEKIN